MRTALSDTLDDCVSREMQAHDIPGLSLAIVNDSKIVSARVYGSTGLSSGTDVKPNTLFQAASISKVLTAVAALRLAEQKNLSLDADINTLLQDWKIPENELTKVQKVTIRRILSHTAGFNVHGFPGYPPNLPLPSVVDILEGRGGSNTSPVRVESVPGSQWLYSGGGYLVLQKMMSDQAGEPFATLLNRLVLGPLRMEHSTFEQPLPAQLIPLAARGHSPLLTGGGQWNVFPEMAAAGLWSTPSDLALLVIALQRALGGEADGIISPNLAKLMTTPVMNGDGLGLFVSGVHDEFFSHTGRTYGFDSILKMSSKSGVIIMINSNDDSGSLERIFKIAWTTSGLSPALPTPNLKLDSTIDPKSYPDYVGQYDYGDKILEITVENGCIYAQLTGQNKFEIFPSGPDTFFLKVAVAGLIFERDKTGTVIAVTHIQNENAFHAPKLSATEAPPLSAELLDSLAGQYQCRPGLVLTIRRKGNQLSVQLTGQPEFPLFPRSDHEFYLKVVPASVDFLRDSNGRVVSALLHQNGQALSMPKIYP